MAEPGATLDRAVAIEIINQYRATTGQSPLVLDPGLSSAAASAAAVYASASDFDSARTRLGPVEQRVDGQGMVAEKISAGHTNFAETFSGWRANPNDAEALSAPWARRAGIGVLYDANSQFGAYWVLILAAGA
jgi:uncharacterized protein YkwD